MKQEQKDQDEFARKAEKKAAEVGFSDQDKQEVYEGARRFANDRNWGRPDGVALPKLQVRES